MRILSFSYTLPGLLAALALGAGCSDSGDGLDVGPADAGAVDTGPVDTGVPEDAGIVDTGPPPPCLFDQGGEENRGCEPGFVCNIETGQCEAGKPCTSNRDCVACSALQSPEDCGHGFSITAWCDSTHGNVCTRSRAPCEPCNTNSDCGLVDYAVWNADPDNPNPDTDVKRCVDYGDGESFCGRPAAVGCPRGFIEDTDSGQCVRERGCPSEPPFCPRGTASQTCSGVDQICSGATCDDGVSICVGNNLPREVGLCLAACRVNADCPADRPVCNPDSGLCGTGCTKDSCAPPQVCHVDGFCASQCESDMDCTMATSNNSKVYGTDMEVYCNLPGRQAPRLFKGGTSQSAYRDANSCAPLGCERAVDCPGAGIVCDPATNPPECRPGCFTAEDDCRSGEVCKSGPQGNYSREGCRALPNKSSEDEIGVCCFPGCTDRVLQCDLNEFCCGEPGSPFEDGSMCPPLTNSSTIAADPGVCFDLVRPPFCVIPDMDNPCNSGWTAGFNTDPDVMGGIPFQEQEFPFGVAVGMMAVPVCGVTCDPEAPDNACPRGWNCGPVQPGCFQDADCGVAGLTCIGANTSAMPPVPGDCKCGEDGQVSITCPNAYGGPGMNLGTVEHPRCRDPEGDGVGDMYCTAAYNCRGPGSSDVYPPECGF